MPPFPSEYGCFFSGRYKSTIPGCSYKQNSRDWRSSGHAPGSTDRHRQQARQARYSQARTTFRKRTVFHVFDRQIEREAPSNPKLSRPTPRFFHHICTCLLLSVYLTRNNPALSRSPTASANIALIGRMARDLQSKGLVAMSVISSPLRVVRVMPEELAEIVV